MTDLSTNATAKDKKDGPNWIRGVNLGGWLVMERYIVPYQFAITTCHVQGDFCWYPGALSAPPLLHKDYKLCDLTRCHPYRNLTIFNGTDYPIDEWNLAKAFDNQTLATKWFDYHFNNFIRKEDLVRMKKAGLTHLRVPLPHWIRGDIRENEPWIAGNRWKVFVRLCQWCRNIGLEVWPNLHTAPGSQNGFDNSGIESSVYTCKGWGRHPENIERTLDVIHEISDAIAKDHLLDVVTGFGLLNEPFGDCKLNGYERFLEDALAITRANMGPNVHIFVSDLFGAPKFNDGSWWLDPVKYHNTYLDTHFYHTFDSHTRSMSPKEHINHVCHPEELQAEITSCCYQDAPSTNSTPSRGVKRISAEWSAAYDAMPGELLQFVMEGIAVNGTAPDFYRILEPDRREFLRKFVESQMVAYEAADSDLGRGWFYWTIKMEGGAFAEWDFSRGLEEGWIPPIATPGVASQDVYGNCDRILESTNNSMAIVHAFPWGDESYWKQYPIVESSETRIHRSFVWLGTAFVLAFALSNLLRRRRQLFGKYTSIDSEVDVEVPGKSNPQYVQE